MTEPYKDIVSCLAKKLQTRGLELILYNFTVQELLNAEKVSAEWKEIISTTSNVWKKLLNDHLQSKSDWENMFNMLVSCYPAWMESLKTLRNYRCIYFEIVKLLENVDNNWLAGSHKKLEYSVCEWDNRVKMYGNKIALSEIWDNIAIYNRWTGVKEHVFGFSEDDDFPIAHNELLDLQLNEHVLVAVYDEKGLLIWNLNTKQLIFQRSYRSNEWKGKGRVRLRGKKIIFSCCSISTDPDQMYFYLFELNEAGDSLLDEEGQLLEFTRVLLKTDHTDFNVIDFNFDDLLLVIYFAAYPGNWLEVWSMVTKEKLYEVTNWPNNPEKFNGAVCFTNGIMRFIFGPSFCGNELMRFFNVTDSKLECIGSVSLQGFKLNSHFSLPLKFIGDKYVALLDKNYQLKILDFQLMISRSMESNGEVQHIDDCLLADYGILFPETTSSCKLLADEFQIVLAVKNFGQNRIHKDQICVLDFTIDREIKLLTRMLAIEPPQPLDN